MLELLDSPLSYGGSEVHPYFGHKAILNSIFNSIQPCTERSS